MAAIYFLILTLENTEHIIAGDFNFLPFALFSKLSSKTKTKKTKQNNNKKNTLFLK